ncbi:DedA family protein [Paenibacillus arenilitoris]|uniref:DedA family protein n=1 Tax=Paenibacillus arenilitoris TaxID=2772299 RepID=A0A927CI94_9BACL|nr:DedA family protein [Paenibacillus arenilitoris]MBD2867990.1 DedA family protein [Paenibacillus arenilitoris]
MNVIEMVERLFEQFGYLVLFVGLPLDFIALPIPPGNSTLTFTGFLSYKGVLEPALAVAAAIAGALAGVTITYLIGYRLGMPLIERYGKWLFLKPAVIEKTRRYYDKYGNKLLLIAFFIPGIRQFIGYFIGIIRVPYGSVAIYAYAGTVLWVIVFFGIGYLFGEQWQHVFALVERYLKWLFIGLGGLLGGLIVRKGLKRRNKARLSDH